MGLPRRRGGLSVTQCIVSCVVAIHPPCGRNDFNAGVVQVLAWSYFNHVGASHLPRHRSGIRFHFSFVLKNISRVGQAWLVMAVKYSIRREGAGIPLAPLRLERSWGWSPFRSIFPSCWRPLDGHDPDDGQYHQDPAKNHPLIEMGF